MLNTEKDKSNNQSSIQLELSPINTTLNSIHSHLVKDDDYLRMINSINIIFADRLDILKETNTKLALIKTSEKPVLKKLLSTNGQIFKVLHKELIDLINKLKNFFSEKKILRSKLEELCLEYEVFKFKSRNSTSIGIWIM